MFIPPMLLETAAEPFDSANHIFEPKIDGHRTMYARLDGKTKLYTRRGNEVTRKYPELLEGFEDDLILDGEVALTDPETGRISFEALNDRFQLRQEEKIALAASSAPVSFIAFDILRYRGKDLRSLPLMRRKEILAGLTVRDNPNLSIIPYLERHGTALFESIKERGMEGIVAKEKTSRYAVGRRARKWQKIINWTYVDVVITGYRKSQFGWLAAIPDGEELQPAGMIEFGVSPAHKKAFYEVCRSIESGSYKDFIHLEPLLRAKVKTRNVTRSGTLRDPVFVDFIA
ncbi:ATP-dependent DNA ligase [Paenibacillus antri]|uniref:ATP-dependent DNA ligase n=1 Tax=Paenibacillus antri TaxID=2582848 RepID=A0A5R9G6V1_9BACL|nr:RNA ligase family protein [Paenibacillus antri]TLS51441.1 ATP-dependent DNA ligase [Paenibacillus antri]